MTKSKYIWTADSGTHTLQVPEMVVQVLDAGDSFEGRITHNDGTVIFTTDYSEIFGLKNSRLSITATYNRILKLDMLEVLRESKRLELGAKV